MFLETLHIDGRSRRLLAVGLLVALAWALVLSGSARVAHAAENPDVRMAVITGTVTDQYSESVSELVTVRVFAAGADPTGTPSHVESAIAGRFTINLPVGVYDVYIDGERHESWRALNVGLIPDEVVDLRVSLILTNQALLDNVDLGARYLLSTQSIEGNWGEGLAGGVEATAWSLIALSASGVVSSAPMSRAVAWLAQTQNHDGSWGAIGDSRLLLTGLALKAITTTNLGSQSVMRSAETWLLSELSNGSANHTTADLASAVLGLTAFASDDERLTAAVASMAANVPVFTSASAEGVALWAMAMKATGSTPTDVASLEAWAATEGEAPPADAGAAISRLGWWPGSVSEGSWRALALLSVSADRQIIETTLSTVTKHQNRHRPELPWAFLLNNWDLITEGDTVSFWGSSQAIPAWITGTLPRQRPAIGMETAELDRSLASGLSVSDARVGLDWTVNPLGQFLTADEVGWDAASSSFASTPDGGWGEKLGVVSEPRTTALSVLALAQGVAPAVALGKQVITNPADPAVMTIQLSATNIGRTAAEFVLTDSVPFVIQSGRSLEWLLPLAPGEQHTVAYDVAADAIATLALAPPEATYIALGQTIHVTGTGLIAPELLLSARPPANPTEIVSPPGFDPVPTPPVGNGISNAVRDCSGLVSYGCLTIEDYIVLIGAALTVFGGSGMVIARRRLEILKAKRAAKRAAAPAPAVNINAAVAEIADELPQVDDPPAEAPAAQAAPAANPA